MAKNSKLIKYNYTPLLVVASAVLLAVVLGGSLYQGVSSKGDSKMPPTKSRLAYVDGTDATAHVTNFYRQYIDQRLNSKIPDYQEHLVKGYGNNNLLFYSQYYRHGFDPITCSTVMPRSVTTSLASTGPVATVNVFAEYPDNTKLTIVAKVVLSDKLAIDSITCPGDKGNLPPKP